MRSQSNISHYLFVRYYRGYCLIFLFRDAISLNAHTWCCMNEVNTSNGISGYQDVLGQRGISVRSPPCLNYNEEILFFLYLKAISTFSMLSLNLISRIFSPVTAWYTRTLPSSQANQKFISFPIISKFNYPPLRIYQSDRSGSRGFCISVDQSKFRRHLRWVSLSEMGVRLKFTLPRNLRY